MEKEVVRELLEQYRTHSCLWDAKADNYHNKVERNKAFEDLKNILLKLDSQCTINDVKKKINNLRTAGRKEMKKVG